MSIKDWATKVHMAGMAQPALTPVIVCADNKMRGMGTLVSYPFGTIPERVITVRHLFDKKYGEAQWTAHPVGDTKICLNLGLPEIIESAGSDDVVSCRVVVDPKNFLGVWDQTLVPESPRKEDQFKLKDPINIRCLLSGRKIELTHKATRPSGEEIFAARGVPSGDDGESGSGFLGTDGRVHVFMGGTENRSVFSKRIRFPHQR